MSDLIERLTERPYRMLNFDRDTKEAADRIAKLEAAAARVCWFDWSTSNDADAVATIDELRRVLGKGNDQ